MLEHHSVFVAEASLLRRFLARTAAAGFQPGSPVAMNIDELALAFEDLPEDIHATVRMALMRPGEDTSLRAAVLDAAKNLAGLAWGDVETLTQQLQTLHVLAHLALHQPYTYRVDQTVVRGARPTPAKLAALAAAGCTTTINLCREMPNGDTDLLEHAGLSADQMGTVHIPVTDCTPPGPDDITTFLEAVAGARRGGSVYVHCEAGVGRTGVMIACYRLQQGWDTADAVREARNFGCSMPDQIAFIQQYRPASPMNTRQPTPDELRQDVALNIDPTGLQRALSPPPQGAPGR